MGMGRDNIFQFGSFLQPHSWNTHTNRLSDVMTRGPRQTLAYLTNCLKQ